MLHPSNTPINESFAKKLKQTYKGRPYGSLLGYKTEKDKRRIKSQIAFLHKMISGINPKAVLEIGTNCGHFDLFLLTYFPEIKRIDTFDIEPSSKGCVALLRKKYKKDIRFHLGDSTKTLRRFLPEHSIDFAWVDGGHTKEVALSNLGQCKRLKIPYLCVDDINNNAVNAAVKIFLRRYPDYKIVRKSKDADLKEKWRGIYLLKGSDPNG